MNFLLSLSVMLLLGTAHADYLSEAEVLSTLTSQGLDEAAAKSVISKIKKKERGSLPISGVLKTSEFNVACFRDSNDLTLDTTFKTGSTLVKIPDMFAAYYENGGLTFDICYRWIFVLITGEEDVVSMDGAIYGRGVGVTLDAGIGVEAQYLPGKNRVSDLWILSPKIGIGGGIVFPKMTFTQRIQK